MMFCCVILCVVCEEYNIINDDYIIIIFQVRWIHFLVDPVKDSALTFVSKM